ncbi:Alanine racemase [Leptospirillum ferriphilum]|uniref:Alanine racemase n=1 Tax=Leptospirillum ferriphilum TaxID=178606 RepID=A0A094YN56_9BACT|nr:alanine racemase [Leptospirillum ferriphilum]KGA94671.1 Alanine racemase [Leptospirillum ferriphilum]
MESESSLIEIPGYAGRDLSRSRLIVDLDALSNNLEWIRSRLPSSIEILPVVKADAYGHGMLPVAKNFVEMGVPALGVMGLEEGVRLRKAEISAKVIVMGGILPSELEECISCGLTPVIHNCELLEAALDLARKMEVHIHLKFDVGMGRLGFLPEDISWVCDKIEMEPSIRIEGVMSHFPEGENISETSRQIAIFGCMVDELWDRGVLYARPFVIHLANSAAFLSGQYSVADKKNRAWEKYARYWIRPGILLYGIPVDPLPLPGLNPAMEIQARLISLKTLSEGSRISYGGTFSLSRKTRVGVLGMGYADGLPRELSNWGWASRMGQKFPFLGRVCMDMVMVDVTDAESPVCLGDWMTVLGNGDDSSMSAWEIAGRIRSIPYEIVCRMGNRSPRFYSRKASSSGNSG